MSAYPTAMCHHCMGIIEDFGGVWFVVGAGSVCYRSPDTQHRPFGRLLDVPPPKPKARRKPTAKTADTRVDHAALAAALVAMPLPAAPLPASVIARGADTDSTHGAAGRKRWN